MATRLVVGGYFFYPTFWVKFYVFNLKLYHILKHNNMNRFLFFALCILLLSSCRDNLIKGDVTPSKPCIWQTDLPDTVGSWHVDTFSLPKNDRYNKDLFFLNENVGFLLKDYYSLFKTTNGGLSWTKIGDIKDSDITEETYFINENGEKQRLKAIQNYFL